MDLINMIEQFMLNLKISNYFKVVSKEKRYSSVFTYIEATQPHFFLALLSFLLSSIIELVCVALRSRRFEKVCIIDF